jgi:hypothetical protein
MVNRATAEELCFLRVITVNQAREFIGLEPLTEAGDRTGDRTGTRDIGAGDKYREVNPYLAQVVDAFMESDTYKADFQKADAGDRPK